MSDLGRKVWERLLPALLIGVGAALAPATDGWAAGIIALGVVWALDGIHDAIKRGAIAAGVDDG